MTSQRAREARIVQKLRSSLLPPAPATPPETRATNSGQCLGCDELEADTLVGGQAWHYLCALYWHGRSELLRAHDAASARGGALVKPERSRWVIVVRPDRPATYTTLPPGESGVPLHVAVESADLHRLHQALGSLPNTQTHPEYHPHVTLAYLKPETVTKYLGALGPLFGESATLETVSDDRLRRRFIHQRRSSSRGTTSRASNAHGQLIDIR